MANKISSKFHKDYMDCCLIGKHKEMMVDFLLKNQLKAPCLSLSYFLSKEANSDSLFTDNSMNFLALSEKISAMLQTKDELFIKEFRPGDSGGSFKYKGFSLNEWFSDFDNASKVVKFFSGMLALCISPINILLSFDGKIFTSAIFYNRGLEKRSIDLENAFIKYDWRKASDMNKITYDFNTNLISHIDNIEIGSILDIVPPTLEETVSVFFEIAKNNETKLNSLYRELCWINNALYNINQKINAGWSKPISKEDRFILMSLKRDFKIKWIDTLMPFIVFAKRFADMGFDELLSLGSSLNSK